MRLEFQVLIGKTLSGKPAQTDNLKSLQCSIDVEGELVSLKFGRFIGGLEHRTFKLEDLYKLSQFTTLLDETILETNSYLQFILEMVEFHSMCKDEQYLKIDSWIEKDRLIIELMQFKVRVNIQ